MKKSLVSLAVTSAVVGLASSANAMYVNERGTGEALVFPYYSAVNGNDTTFSIVNTTGLTKAVKVRIIEALDSQEVLDFNLYLSPDDVFAAVITQDPNGDGAIIRTVDTSCTVPELGQVAFGGSSSESTRGRTQLDQPFVNFLFNGFDATTDLTRTRSGYIEVFEMAQFDPNDGGFGEAAVHEPQADGPPVPADCESIQAAWNLSTAAGGAEGGVWAGGANLTDVISPWDGGGLYGFATVLNVLGGTAASYDALAIEDWYNPTYGPANYHREPGDVAPSFADSNTSVTLFTDVNGVADTIDLDFFGSPDSFGANVPASESLLAASALMMTLDLKNDYVVDSEINALTDWVITMPTKRDFTVTDVTGGVPNEVQTPADVPFTDRWDGEKACEAVVVDFWDREEAPSPPNLGGFSPRPPGSVAQDFELCTEVSVVHFGDASALSADPSILYGLNSVVNFADGWAEISFDSGRTVTTDDHAIEDANGNIVSGLPAIGFAVFNYQNGTLTDAAGTAVNSAYSSAVKHKSVLSIQTATP